ncbi:MAG TPA: glycine cleavage system aminomethyltransferase GcvT [Dehalococcoidia bacterium]|nr:glycine cleavage system aminomethyltransferase GcvT [Dehalococcoidia bacterium]HIK88526.1 glycine cleavage system aminomethyltransferase GcvT [Dehalococcoidia bacterium]
MTLSDESQTQPEATLKKTVLHALHVESGAKMVPFGGWDMPVQYSNGIISEVKAVRNSAGIFDVSHMGRLEFEGSGAESFLGSILSANMPILKVGRSKYSFICNASGGIIDDAMVYKVADEKFLLVINAGNADVDMEWINPLVAGRDDFTMTITTAETAMIAIQGPNAVEIVDQLTSSEASKIRRFRTGSASVNGIPAILARTGYTGEDGFEIIVAADKGAVLWNTLKEAGATEAGLGARDVLRLEAGLPLHGNDLSEETNPFEAGFGRFASSIAPDSIAADALNQIAKTPLQRTLVGFKMTGRGIPRTGLNILSDDASATSDANSIGTVTSGTHSPTVDGGIGMGYVEQKYSAIDTQIVIDVRGRLVEAEIVEMPFYKRG